MASLQNSNASLLRTTARRVLSFFALSVALALSAQPAWSQQTAGSTTILPTDTALTPILQNKPGYVRAAQIRALQYLPTKLYFTEVLETSLRYESNPYQYPRKQKVVKQYAAPGTYQFLTPGQQQQINNVIHNSDRGDGVFRVLPNTTVGWAFTPKTRIFANYFLIRDSLFNQVRLNTTVQSLSWGAQHDIQIGKHAVVQPQIQFRELWQTHEIPVFDYMPNITVSYMPAPSTIVFTNVLLQMRGKQYFVAPNREIDPFYSVGITHQRGRWQFTANTTFVQNFRQPFGQNALIHQDNYAIISDFEVAHRSFPAFPALQTFVRAEPIWNMHSRNTPGLSGIDFRLFGGVRLAVAKRPLTTSVQEIRDSLENEALQPQ